MRFLFALALFLLLPAPLLAYTTHRSTTGPLAMHFGTPDRLSKQEIITRLDEPLTLTATLENKSGTPLSVKLTFQTIETFELLDGEERTLVLPGNGSENVSLNVVARAGTYTAHYPVRLDAEFQHDGVTMSAHIIQVIETNVPLTGSTTGDGASQTDALPLNILPERGGLALATLATYRGVWNHDNRPTQLLPVGFQGTDSVSRASITRVSMDRVGVGRQSFGMHPPWQGGVGNVGVEFRMKLPETQPISLSFFSAVRDVQPPESPSDGITYRIKVDAQTVYEKHDAETVWVAHEVDLSAFAGKEIMLTLESDPGPKRNTVCDQCYWGDVILFAGEMPTTLSAEEKRNLFAENLNAVKTARSESPKTHVYNLDGGLTAAVSFGNNGFVDGVIGLGNMDKQVQFDGLRVWVKGQLLGNSPSAVSTTPWRGSNFTPNIWTQEIATAGRTETLFFAVQQNGPALQLSINALNDDVIDRIEFGSATHHAPKVYYGHGFCIVEPKAFIARGDGHNLSTSHVGMDFDNGLSVLQASSFFPDRFVVEPSTKRYTLSVHPGTTMTLLPGLNGALDCAVRFRPVYHAPASPGAAVKAGRFVFDIWGGRYSEHLNMIRNAADYGMTDSLFIVHDWQHYGYDNRLPDIWPPNERWGTLTEMKEALELCNSLGILYGVHDNYIDIYPDADGYNFDMTSFNITGQPRRAWNNYGIEAQSYQFRPDQFQPFMNHNLDMIVSELPMSAYFVDVFSSAPPMDYYDRDGNFHSRTKTQKLWAESFDTIRDRLSASNKNFPSAVTIGESGNDALIGHLDGSDCNFMFISSEPGEFRINIDCQEWSRVPWYAAVNHTRFSLHGVGYSSRYEVQRGRDIHGIESDDYITSEILTGNAMMVDRYSAMRGAVRKYWLAQDFIRYITDKDIVNVEFADNNIHRQMITWTGDAVVWVNLDNSDWVIKPEPQSPVIVLPRYGYFASFPKGFSAIFRQNGRVVEAARTESNDGDQNVRTDYFNARQQGIEGLLPITPTIHAFQYLGDNRFSATFQWNAKDTITRDLNIFVHCVERRRAWHHRPIEATLAGGFPVVPTSQWSGEVITDNHSPKNAEGAPVTRIPDELPAGRYYLVVGLYDSSGNGHRGKLMGFNTGADRYAVGWLNVQRNPDGAVSNIAFEPLEWDESELYERLLPPKEPVEFFDVSKTKGAIRIVQNAPERTMIVTPMYNEPETEIAIALPDRVRSVKAVDASGEELRDVPFRYSADEKYPLEWTTQRGEFAYKIVW